MSNIDKDIEIVEELIKASREVREEQFCELIGIKQIQAIANVLEDRERLEKEIDKYKAKANANDDLVEK